MCYPKPGPRCSSHAFQALKDANAKYQTSKLSNDESVKMKAYKSFHDAELEYHMTPGGQKHLQDRIAKTGDPTGKFANRLEMAKKARKEAIARVKMKDVGDITHNASASKPKEASPAVQGVSSQYVAAPKQSQGAETPARKASALSNGTPQYSNYNTSLIPQANDLEKVSSTVDAVSARANTSSSIAESLGVQGRQGNYYANAAEYIGLVSRHEADGEYEYRLTPNGEKFQESDSGTRKKMLNELVSATPVMRSYRESGYNKESLVDTIKSSGYDDETAKRRANAFVTWHKKLGDANFESVLESTRTDTSERSVQAAKNLKELRDARAKEKVKTKEFGYCPNDGMALNANGECGWCG